MENPRVSETWNRAWIGLLDVAGFGVNWTRSTTSRFGRLTCETRIAAPPCADFAGAIKSVSAVVATLDPLEFVAVTCTRSVWATSAEVSAYVVPVAPGTAAQPPPVPVQRCHSYEKCG